MAQIEMTPAESRIARRQVADELFWAQGLWSLWNRGRRDEARDSMKRALAQWPWSPRMWKAYLMAKWFNRV
jgi:hypothetical protein